AAPGVGPIEKAKEQPPCSCICAGRRDATPNRSGAGYSAARRRCEGLPDARGRWWGTSREPQRPEAWRLHGRDDGPQKGDRRSRQGGPRDDGRDRVGRCGTAHVRSASSLRTSFVSAASVAGGLEAIVVTAWWRGSGPTSLCPTCSLPWRHVNVERSSRNHAAQGSRTSQRVGQLDAFRSNLVHHKDDACCYKRHDTDVRHAEEWPG